MKIQVIKCCNEQPFKSDIYAIVKNIAKNVAMDFVNLLFEFFKVLYIAKIITRLIIIKYNKPLLNKNNKKYTSTEFLPILSSPVRNQSLVYPDKAPLPNIIVLLLSKSLITSSYKNVRVSTLKLSSLIYESITSNGDI